MDGHYLISCTSFTHVLKSKICPFRILKDFFVIVAVKIFKNCNESSCIFGSVFCDYIVITFFKIIFMIMVIISDYCI